MKKVLLFAIGCMLAFSGQANTTKDDAAQNNAQTVATQSGKPTITILVHNMGAEGRMHAHVIGDIPVYSNLEVFAAAYTTTMCGNYSPEEEHVDYVHFILPAGSWVAEADLPLMCDYPQRIVRMITANVTPSDDYANYEVIFQ